jgi:hypothetical protein
MQLEVLCCVILIWLDSSPTQLKSDMKEFTSTYQTHLSDSWHHYWFVRREQVWFSTLRWIVPEENFLPISQSQRANAAKFYPKCGKDLRLNTRRPSPHTFRGAEITWAWLCLIAHALSPWTKHPMSLHRDRLVYTCLPRWDSSGCQPTQQEPAFPSPIWTFFFIFIEQRYVQHVQG